MPEVSRRQVLGFRWRAQQLNRSTGSASGLDDVALLDLGVQDTGPAASRWALANRGLSSYDVEDTLLAWTLRVSPHVYRRRDTAAVVVATAPFTEADAGKRIFDAAKPLREAVIGVLDSLAGLARLERELVAEPLVKGELSTALTPRLEPAAVRTCRPCGVDHAWESSFRMAALQGGLELRPGTSPPVLQRIAGLEPPYFAVSGAEADPRFDVVRGYLRFYGPARPQEVAGFLDAPVAEVRRHWPADVVEAVVEGWRASVLAEDLPRLLTDRAPERSVRLLHPFDPWLQLRDRTTLVPDPDRRRDLWRTLGRPGAVVVDGEVVGTWRPSSKGRRLTVSWQPWQGLSSAELAALDEQAQRLAAVRDQELVGLVREEP